MPVASNTDNSPEGIRQEWEKRIRQAREAKKPYEPEMLVNLAFAAGNHWHVWDRNRRQVRRIDKVDPRYAGRELYTSDRITEYRAAQLGELSIEDDRPTLLAVQEGETAEEAAEQLNDAVDHAWQHEWCADTALRKARAFCVDMGVSAIRCKWNPTVGKVVGRHPLDQQGKPIPAQSPLLQELEQSGTVNGALPQFKQVREGRTEWDAYSALQILPPPGFSHEDDFPWDILVGTADVDDLKAEYGQAAAGLTEDMDIVSGIGMTAGQENATGQLAGGRARNRVWLFLCFQRPTTRYPDGRKAILASNQYVLLDTQDELDYQTPDGTPHTGIVYLHWWRLSDRFWSRSFIAGLKDPQRIINRRKTQNLEIIDRGMPKVYTTEGDLVEEPRGVPMENVKLSSNAKNPPVFFPGAGPGGWMYQDIEALAEDLSHAATMSALKLGENPPNVDTYSQFAALNELELIKRSQIKAEHRSAINTLVELSVGDIIRYWPEEKQILVAGDDDRIGFQFFKKARIPAFFMCKVAKGDPQPQSQAGELKKLDAIWAAAVQAWVAVNDGQTWVEWYADSIEAGKPLDLPQAPKDSQAEQAKLENLLMMQGVQPPVMDYDQIQIHLAEHRRAEDEARAAGDTATVLRIDQHVKDHIAMAQQNVDRAQASAAQAGGPQPAGAQPQDQGQGGGGVNIQPPFAREPAPQVIPRAFAQLSRGQ